jgi:hypothetical protein
MLVSLLIVCAVASHAADAPKIKAYFSPGGGCTAAVVDALVSAKATVFVQAYSFTSAPIAKALVDAHRRGVKVQVILDKSQRTEKYSSATFLRNEGVPPLIDTKHAIAHSLRVMSGNSVGVPFGISPRSDPRTPSGKHLRRISGCPHQIRSDRTAHFRLRPFFHGQALEVFKVNRREFLIPPLPPQIYQPRFLPFGHIPSLSQI